MSIPPNQPYETIQFAAVADRGDYYALTLKANDQLRSLEKRIGKRWKSSDTAERRQLTNYQGTIYRLRSFLLQVRRMAEHARGLCSTTVRRDGFDAKLVPGMSLGLVGHDICTDFESLLLHGRAVLDKLSWAISAEYSQKCSRFPKLENVLSNFPTDKRAIRLRKIINESSGLSGTLVDIAGGTALRSKVAHIGSMAEHPHHIFSLHCIEDGRLLIFDCESLGFPVFGTSFELAAAIPYVVQNSLAIYLGAKRLPTQVFQPNWSNPSIRFDQYVSKDGNGIPLSVYRVDPELIQSVTKILDPSVLDRAVAPVD